MKILPVAKYNGRPVFIREETFSPAGAVSTGLSLMVAMMGSGASTASIPTPEPHDAAI